MFLRATTRKKDGKEHRYWSVVENRRVAGGRVAQRHVLYLGEINSSQELAWRKSIEVLEDGVPAPRTYALFPEDRCEGLLWARLAQLQTMELSRDALLMKLGSAQSKVPAAWRLVEVKVEKTGAASTFRLNSKKPKQGGR